MLLNGFFITESHNPDLPPETYSDLVYTKTTSGNYSTSLGWGKYKIVFSGGGGSGAALAYGNTESHTQENGKKGEEKTVYVSVYHDTTKIISGIIGSGGSRSYAKALHHVQAPILNPPSGTATAGNAGSGYQNGSKGSTKLYTKLHKRTGYADGIWDEYAIAGGSGGGSTSVVVDGVFNSSARGGNGGGGSQQFIGTVSGGTGAGGGISNGTGASGGSAASKYNGECYSTAGTSGYVKIYKSNLKPEFL